MLEVKQYHGGFDPGYGTVTLAIIKDGKLKSSTEPSIVGQGDTNIGQMSIGELGRQRRRNLPDEIRWQGGTFVVGRHAYDYYTHPMDSYDLDRLQGTPSLRALFYATVGRCLGKGIHHLASLFVGLPVNVMMNDDLATETSDALRSWMVGEHEFSINDSTVKLTVDQIRTMAQPLGTFFAWGLNDQGGWYQDGVYLEEASTAVLDIGFNTVDLAALRAAEITKRFTGSDERGNRLGMRQAAEYLMGAVREEYDYQIASIHQADEFLRKDPAIIITGQGKTDITHLTDSALSSLASRIISYVEEDAGWGDGRQFAKLLITGGGGLALQKQLVRAFPRAIIVEDPIKGNAIGLARFAYGLTTNFQGQP